MQRQPRAIVYDVNETLSDMSAMAERFRDVGAPPHLARLWFASVLRDGFALTAAGSAERFAVLGEHALGVVLSEVELDRPMAAAIDHVLSGIATLPLHPDVAGGVRRLGAAGIRQVTLSNGAAAVAESLLVGAGIRDAFDMLLSVEDADAWKPAASAYQHAASATGVPTDELMLVAVHPWDIHGAARAGLRTAWVDRAGTEYPHHFAPPETSIRSLEELADALGA